jgi:hypothetical protein
MLLPSAEEATAFQYIVAAGAFAAVQVAPEFVEM